MSETVLSLKTLETRYGAVYALKGINLEVRKGEIVTLLGSNGAGKSTTLKTISSLIRACGGSVEFMGKNITHEEPHVIVQMGVIHVPEGRKILKELTVLENLELASFTLKDNVERQKRIEHVYEFFPVLKERQKQMGGLLSGGEQQMLAIGRGMMVKPKIMLLDEPSMGLAPIIVQSIMKIIKQINAEGTTILLVEQNAKIALKLATRGYVLETGNIVAEGDAATLSKDESIVKAYLGH
ncbi:MAG: ABC transporter ATP-binding protein [Clostridiales bacterium]|nr:ABC transporter ATP-binding protein [Clostridiales bacterium]